MIRKLLILTSLLFVWSGVVQADGIRRTDSGKPDLTGTYNAATLTPMNRPEIFGDKQFMTREEADATVAAATAELAIFDKESDPDRGAPVKGGDGNQAFGAGGVGGYNSFWIDRGDDVVEIGGKIRTSIVYDPPNGRQPPMTPQARMKMADSASSFIHENDGTASWLAHDGPGPFDGPESLALSERCLLGFSGGPPQVPSLYNNYSKIMQTENHVVILIEMVHDARIIRLNSEHGPSSERKWLGDSIGHWDGDTLIVDTINFRKETGLGGADENLHLTEQFTLQEDGNIVYNFTVDDPTAWTASWSGEYIWKGGDDKVYEYACHDGPGPFDGPESLALSERCLLGFSGGPPQVPSLYNNYSKIMQTENHVVILIEMVHDARIIRLNSEHGPSSERKWLGDSIGHWDGDTLIVDTINFRKETGLGGADENLHLTEQFTLQEDGNIVYNFTVDDPTAWTASWSGEYIWKGGDDKVYEYACHEGNYAMGNILRGARLLEKEFVQESGGE